MTYFWVGVVLYLMFAFIWFKYCDKRIEQFVTNAVKRRIKKGE